MSGTVATLEATPVSALTLDRGLTHPLDLSKEQAMADPIECAIIGCDRPRRSLSTDWCNSHYMRWWRYGAPEAGFYYDGVPVYERFWSRIEEGPAGCWLWAGPRKDGYGVFSISKSVHRYAHCFAWEHLVGEIPDGLDLDHLCRVRHCVNRDHLEPVTPAVNNERTMPFRAVKTHCVNGHEYNSDNTGRDANGHRYCKACSREAARRYRAKKLIMEE